MSEVEKALKNYEHAKSAPIEELISRVYFSEMDTGFKNHYSGSLIRARHDGVVEIYAHGDKPVGIRGNPNLGTLNHFAAESIRFQAPYSQFFTEDNGIEINGRPLNYEVLDQGKLLFFDDDAIAALRKLLSQGVIGAPAPGQMPVAGRPDGVKDHRLFLDQEDSAYWDPVEKKALEALGLQREAGLK